MSDSSSSISLGPDNPLGNLYQNQPNNWVPPNNQDISPYDKAFHKRIFEEHFKDKTKLRSKFISMSEL